MRIDIFLVEKNLAKSRERAKELIKNQQVSVNNLIINKPSYEVNETDLIDIIGEQLQFVGRGGLKLKHALDLFQIDLNNKVCLDIGASTGGFTDCMLQNGAELIYSVDVGHDQLDISLVNNKKVVNMERTNIKNLCLSDFENKIDFIATDVSFISLTQVLPKIYEFMDDDCSAVVLIKPQFEAGKSDIGKNGIVKNPKIHIRVLNEILSFCTQSGFYVCKLDYSPICGGDGNIEYLARIIKSRGNSCMNIFDTNELVLKAFTVFKKER